MMWRGRLDRLFVGSGKFWRSFLFEVSVVVVGVLLALAANSWSEERQWRQRVVDARAALWADYAIVEQSALERAAYLPCINEFKDRTLALSGSQGNWSGIDMNSGKSVAALVPGMYRRWPTEAWEGARSSDLLAHLDPTERAQYSLIASYTRDTADSQTAGNRARNSLYGLAIPGPMTMGERRESATALAAMYQEVLMASVRARNILELLNGARRFAPPSYARDSANYSRVLDREIASQPQCAIEGLKDLRANPPRPRLWG